VHKFAYIFDMLIYEQTRTCSASKTQLMLRLSYRFNTKPYYCYYFLSFASYFVECCSSFCWVYHEWNFGQCL